MKSEEQLRQAFERMEVHRRILGPLGTHPAVAHSVLGWVLDLPAGDKFKHVLENTESSYLLAKELIAMGGPNDEEVPPEFESRLKAAISSDKSREPHRPRSRSRVRK